MRLLREYIREILLMEQNDPMFTSTSAAPPPPPKIVKPKGCPMDEDDVDPEEKDVENLLTEPDASDDDEQREQNVVANISGVSTPLGTGPTYPRRRKKKKQKPNTIFGAFGGGKR